MDLKFVFVNRYSEIRSGWKALMYMLLAVATALLLGAPLAALKANMEAFGPVVTLAGGLLAAYIMTRFVHRKPLTAIGLSIHPAMPKEFGFGCLLGFLMMSGVFLVEYMLGYARLEWRGLGLLELLGVLSSSAVVFAVAALAEEVLFRGYTLQVLMQGITFLPAALLMALAFSASHAPNPNVSALALVNVGLAAVWLSFAYLKTRSLWLPFGLHFSWNFSQTTIYSFPTSGLAFSEMRMFDAEQSGPAWLTGGAFGPEGGALATVALLVCTWYILKERQLAVPEGIITLDSVEDLLKPGEENRGEGA
jgi:membrane protease YdiL (CAAX protease family)